MSEVVLELLTEQGTLYKGRFVGKRIAEGHQVAVYLTDDDRVILHDLGKDTAVELADPESELRELLANDEYVDACAALGVESLIDL